MKQIIVFIVLMAVITACDKDKVETKPSLKFKSFNSNVLPSDGRLQVNLEFTDQEGDLDSLYVIRRRLNKRGMSVISFPYSGIPAFGGQNRGELAVSFAVQSELIFALPAIGSVGNFEPDTLQLGFYVKDKQDNFSDTTTTPSLIIIRN